MLAALLPVVLLAQTSVPLPTAMAFARAVEAIVRLKPSALPGLPAPVRRELDRRGCAIPQADWDCGEVERHEANAPHNVIRGRFTTSRQVDIAVLCSKDHVSSILVFRGGSAAGVATLASLPDATFLRIVASDGTLGFSRLLGVAGPSYIREHGERYGGYRPPALEHDGINDMFLEKASVVWYREGERWVQLAGAD